MKIFLASSRESSSDMHRVAKWLRALGHEPIPWDTPETFPAGTYLLPRLIELSYQIHGAIFIFGEDDKLWYRRDRVKAPRDNVLLEYGILAATLGPERVLIYRKGQAKKPSDLDGLLHLQVAAAPLSSDTLRMHTL